MATATRKCKVCGVEYEYCHTVRRVAGVFRWQDVSCCPEHGSIYLSKIIASRSTQPSSDNATVAESAVDIKADNTNVEIYIDDDNDEDIDELFEDDFDDADEELAIEY